MQNESSEKSVQIPMKGRVITGFGLFSCLTVLLTQRVNLNVVIPQIVSINNAPGKIHWSTEEKSLVLMSFYIGFCFTQIIGGILAEKYGSKIFLSISMLLSSICCLVSPIALEKSVISLIVIRIFMGAVQGIYVPCVAVMISNWFPRSNQARAAGTIIPGTQFGTILSLFITSSIAKRMHLWSLSFYIFGGLGLVWLVFWQIFITDNPKNNDWVSWEEKDFLKNNIEQKSKLKLKEFPVKKAFTSAPILAVITAHFAAFWNFSLILTIIPSFMKDIFFIEVDDQTSTSFLAPLFSLLGGFSSGFLADFLIRKGILSQLSTRKLFNSITTVPSALFFMFSTFIPPEKYQWGVVLMLMASYFAGIQFCVIFPNISSICFQYCGIISGISNTLASLSGISAIMITYEIVSDQHNVYEWQISFGIMLTVQLIGLVVFAIFAKETARSWSTFDKR